MDLIARIFDVDPSIRYVALYSENRLQSAQRTEVEGASAAESDRYEELFVNPAVLLLTTQRGNLDCGGLSFVIVRYGNFFQVLIPLEKGHLSVCVEATGDPVRIAETLMPLVPAQQEAPLRVEDRASCR